MCPRLDIAKSMEPCDRLSLCNNRTCAADPGAICAVDPCDCTIRFIDYSGQRVNACDTEMGVISKTLPDVSEDSITDSSSNVTSVTSASVSGSITPQHSTIKPDSVSNNVLPTHTLCERKRQYALQKSFHYVPQCDGDGHFLPMQCRDDSVQQINRVKDRAILPRCWCVDESGNRIQGISSFQKGSRECSEYLFVLL